MKNNTEKRKPRTGFIVVAVILTIISGIFTYINRLSYAFDHFRKTNQLSDVQYENIFGWKMREPAKVTIEDLPEGTYFWGVLFISILVLFIYPTMGKLLAIFTEFMEELFVSIYKIDPNDNRILPWDGGIEQFEFGAIWPIGMFYTLFLIIANIIGGIYRIIWPKF